MANQVGKTYQKQQDEHDSGEIRVRQADWVLRGLGFRLAERGLSARYARETEPYSSQCTGRILGRDLSSSGSAATVLEHSGLSSRN